MLTIISALIIFITVISVISYSETRINLEKNWETSMNNSEQHLADSLYLVARGLHLFERTYDRDLKNSFLPFLSEYNRNDRDPMKINLAMIKQNLPPDIASKIDLSIINQNGVVINSTSQPDVDLDFKKWPEKYKEITKIRQANSFQSDRAVIGIHPDQSIRKFAYFPTPDHHYILELSLNIDEFNQDLPDFSFLSIVKTITINNPQITSITLYDSMIRKIQEGDSTQEIASNQTKEIVTSVLENHQRQSITDQNGQISERYIFLRIGNNETVSDNMQDIVAHIKYDTTSYAASLKTNFQYHGLIAIVSVLLSVLLAYLLTRHLTRPIRRIIDDIDQIANGDLDHPIHHTGSPVFTRLEGSISTLVGSLKSLIVTLQEKENKIISSEHIYRSLVESQTDIIIRFDTTATVKYVNKAFCTFFNLRENEVIGTSLYELATGNLLQIIKKYIVSMSSQPEMGIIEHPVILNNGTKKWVQWSSSFIKNESGLVVEYQAVGRDITGKKETEIALTESEEKYRLLIANLPDYVIVHRNAIVIYINEAAAQVLGYTPEELIGKHVIDFVHDQDKEKTTRYMQQRIAGIEIPEYEIQIKRKDATYRNVIVRASIIPYAGSSAFLTVLTDVTDRKRAEELVIKGEQRYRRLIEQLNEGIWITDKEGITTYINSRILDILNFPHGEVIGKPFTSFITPEEIPFLNERMMIRMKGLSERYPLTFIARDGRKVYTDVSASPSFDNDGNVSGSFAVVSDVTRRKEAELKLEKYTRDLETKTQELESARDQLFEINEDLDRIIRERTEQVMNLLKQKDEFIMQLGHDLRTPLTPILGLLPDLINGERDELNCHALRIIRKNVKYIQDIADKSLKLARMSSFDITPEIEPVEIRKAVSSILSMYADELVHAGIVIINNIPPDLKVAADKILYQELMENLITNSIKYIQHKNGEILFTAKPDNTMIEIQIQDNGSGLRAEETEKIFDVFYKADRSRHDKSSTGLGLSICKRIVENHGGSIRAESSGLGKGTRFIILLPAWKK